MKKHWIAPALTAALALGLLAGCGGPEEPAETAQPQPIPSAVPAETPAPEVPVPSRLPDAVPAEQLAVIAENAALWQLPEEASEFDWYAYTVSDLDGNGAPELISTVTRGTGLFTETLVWEVEGDSLVQRTSDACPMVITPMLTADGQTLSLPAYWDEASEQLWLVMYDLVRNGVFGYYENIRTCSLKAGALEGRYLAYRATEYDPEGKETVTCTGPEDQLITQEEYTQAPELALGHLSPRQVSFHWLERLKSCDLTTEELTAVLTQAWEGFLITEG